MRRAHACACALAFPLALALPACTVDTQVARIDADGGATPTPTLVTLPAGSTLPDEATCAGLVQHSTWEPRPANATANHRAATAAEVAQLAPWTTERVFDARALALEARVTGTFVGTTDEILQWIACKWGFDVDHVRAEAAASSGWTQGLRTDWTSATDECPPDADTRQGANGPECAKTYGILQITWQYNQSAWPAFRDSTPFHLDYAFGLRRACLEGWDLSQAARPRASPMPPTMSGAAWARTSAGSGTTRPPRRTSRASRASSPAAPGRARISDARARARRARRASLLGS